MAKYIRVPALPEVIKELVGLASKNMDSPQTKKAAVEWVLRDWKRQDREIAGLQKEIKRLRDKIENRAFVSDYSSDALPRAA